MLHVAHIPHRYLLSTRLKLMISSLVQGRGSLPDFFTAVTWGVPFTVHLQCLWKRVFKYIQHLTTELSSSISLREYIPLSNSVFFYMQIYLSHKHTPLFTGSFLYLRPQTFTFTLNYTNSTLFILLVKLLQATKLRIISGNTLSSLGFCCCGKHHNQKQPRV